MKYKDLINSETCAKLMMVSFSTPQKNLQVYRFANSIMEHQRYFENERTKLLDKYGEIQADGTYRIKGKDQIDEYNHKIDSVLSLEINGEFIDPDLNENDFSDYLCSYPSDKRFWLSANEIAQVLSISKKIKEEAGKSENI